MCRLESGIQELNVPIKSAVLNDNQIFMVGYLSATAYNKMPI